MKKVLALVLAAMMVLAIAPMAFAAKVTEGELGYSSATIAGAATGDETLVGTVNPDKSWKIYLTTPDATVAAGFRYLEKQDIKDSKIDVKARGGSGVFKEAKIAYEKNNADNIAAGIANAAYIEVKLVNPFVSTGTKDFEIIITPVIDRKNLKDAEFTISGTFENTIGDDLDDSYEYANFDKDNRVRKSVDYIKKIELDVDGHLSIFTKLFADKKYYARATNSIKDADMDLFVTYPELDAVYYLETVGLNSVGNYVKLDLDDKTLFVYDGDLNYLGTSADELPVTGKYFVASSELDVADDVEEAPEDEAGIEDEAGSNPNMGGDDVPVNVNDNPGTGC